MYFCDFEIHIFLADDAVWSPTSCWNYATTCYHNSWGARSWCRQVWSTLLFWFCCQCCFSVWGVLLNASAVRRNQPWSFSCRFHVDFIKGHDVVFHFNPRFHEQTIVRNSQLGGCWGPEERDGGFPFCQGRRFEVKFYSNIAVPKIRKLFAYFIHNWAF